MLPNLLSNNPIEPEAIVVCVGIVLFVAVFLFLRD